MNTFETPQTLQAQMNGLRGMGASLAVLELEKEVAGLKATEDQLDLEIQRLTFLRDQLQNELMAVNNARLSTVQQQLSGMGLLKSAYRRQLESSITNKSKRIAEKQQILTSLQLEIEQLQFQLSNVAPDSQVLKATKQAFAPGMSFNPKVLLIAAAVGGIGYLAYTKGWLKKFGIKPA